MKNFLIVYTIEDDVRLYDTIMADSHVGAVIIFEIMCALAGQSITIETVQFLG